MIGIVDSGLGGLTVLKALVERFPQIPFVYLGDHANVPYGDRPSLEIVELTRNAVEALFKRDCKLVLLGCNTATAVAARRLQRVWLPDSSWRGRNVLGIVAPTVEAATQTRWAVTTPQYPQAYIRDTIAVFGTTRTISSGVYPEEIRKRCPRVTVVQQVSSKLAGAIEDGAAEAELEQLVKESVEAMLAQTDGKQPHRAILGCTHFPLVEHLFRKHLAPSTVILSQPAIVADSFEDYLTRRPRYLEGAEPAPPVLLTTGDPDVINSRARIFWPEVPPFTLL